MTYNKDRDAEELLRGIVKLAPEGFIALAKLLGVKLSLVDPDTKEPTLRDAEEVIVDIVAEFRRLKHKERRMILKAVKNYGARS